MADEIYKYSFKNQYRMLSSLTIHRCGFQKYPKALKRGPEIRNHYLLHFVKSGKGKYKIEGNEFNIKCNDMFIIYPKYKIEYMADKDDPWELCWVGFSGTDAATLVGHTNFSLENPILHFDDSQKIYELMMDIYKNRGNHSYQLLGMIASLYNLFSYMLEFSTKDIDIIKTQNLHYIDHAIKIIKENYHRDLSVGSLSNELGLCRSSLYRILMHEMNRSPQQYIIDYKIASSCKIMQQSPHKSIAQIAYLCGFNNPLYFSNVFKKYYGVSPNKYKKSIAQNSPLTFVNS